MFVKNCVFQKHHTFNVISQHQPFGLSMKFETEKKKQNSKKITTERNQTECKERRHEIHIDIPHGIKKELSNESNANVNSEQLTFNILDKCGNCHLVYDCFGVSNFVSPRCLF